MAPESLRTLLASIADYAAARPAGDASRPHRPLASYPDHLERFRLLLADDGVPVDQVIAELIDLAEPGLAAMTGPRFHGWVIGASNPAGVAADWLTSVWGQNAGNC